MVQYFDINKAISAYGSGQKQKKTVDDRRSFRDFAQSLRDGNYDAGAAAIAQTGDVNGAMNVRNIPYSDQANQLGNEFTRTRIDDVGIDNQRADQSFQALLRQRGISNARAEAESLLKQGQSRSPLGKLYDDYRRGLIPKEHLEAAVSKATTAGSGVTVNVGDGEGPNDADLRKYLMQNEGKAWSGALDAGNTAAGLNGDLEALGALIETAPQGPLEGRMAEMFPGFSDSGAAFNSIVKRVAPTLRAEGSGSTSDIEYDGMLQGLPSLSNRPEANRAILQIMQNKAAINQERAAIVMQYQNNQISAVDARKAMGELNSRSIMTPELRASFGNLDQQEAQTAPEGVDAGMWEYMTPEERALWK